MILATLLALAGQMSAPAPAAIMTITVQKLPATFKKSPIVHLDFNGEGGISACTVEETSGSPAIDRVACQQVTQTVTVPASKGKAPESRSTTVEFVTAK